MVGRAWWVGHGGYAVVGRAYIQIVEYYQYLGGLTFYHLMQYYAVNMDNYPFGPNFEV